MSHLHSRHVKSFPLYSVQEPQTAVEHASTTRRHCTAASVAQETSRTNTTHRSCDKARSLDVHHKATVKTIALLRTGLVRKPIVVEAPPHCHCGWC